MKLKTILLFIFYLCFIINSVKAYKTYALIIGIAEYKDDKIKDLQYSDDDALEFYKYLISDAGGKVDSNNIKILLNEQATVGNIYAAKSWLESKVQRGDKAYIYFSGHGDAESSHYKLGFLLAYDSPHKNYLNNAVRIQDFNIMANTLSLDKKANVILITDACRSGSLSGIDDFGKMALVQEELMKAQQKEVRLSSCRPEELSQENKVWGGGRGLFSYYFINGMKGLADKDNNNEVTLNELTNYLQTNIEDEIDKYLFDPQTPVISGIKTTPLSVTSPSLKKITLESLNAQSSKLEEGQTRSLDAVNVSKNQRFIRFLESQNIEKIIDFYSWVNKSGDDFVDTLFNQYLLVTEEKDYYDEELSERIYYIDTTLNLTPLLKDLNSNKENRKLFKIELAAALHNSIQNVINLYLEGDEAELEKRRYYNTYANGYGEIVPMIEMGMKLVPEDDPLYRIFEVKKYYFKGVEARLQLLGSNQKDSLFSIAEKAQMKALTLEPQAAYIQNELGVISMFKKEYLKAELFFKEAISLSENWAIPWANLCYLYPLMENNKEALKAGLKAEILQPNLQMAKVGVGRMYQLDTNYLLAEEYYRDAIAINDQHFLPYEWLGHVYLDRTDYEMADSFLYEAELRKKGLNMQGIEYQMSMALAPSASVNPAPCEIDTSLFLKDDYIAFYYWGKTLYDSGDYINAVRVWKKVVAIDPYNPLVFHYMGKAYYNRSEWAEAELMFRYARDYFVEDLEGTILLNMPPIEYPYDHECYLKFYLNDTYDAVNNYFFLGKVYEELGYYVKAEEEYDYIINDFSYYDAELAYLRKWAIMERFERWEETEESVLSANGMEQGCASCDFPNDELNAFYRRAIDANPDDGIWTYKLALFLYNKRFDESLAPSFDTILYSQVLGKELFIDFSNYGPTNFSGFFDVNQGVPPNVNPSELTNVEQWAKVVPGTLDTVFQAGRIWSPRKDAIKYFELALNYYFEANIKADINFKIAETYLAAGSHQQAFPFFQKATLIQPLNDGFRFVALNTSKTIYRNRATLEHLNSLFNHSALNYETTMLLGEYSIYNKDYKKGEELLMISNNYYPYKPRKALDLFARLYNITGQYQKAINTYEGLLYDGPTNSNFTYSMAKAYALNGEIEKAKEILSSAVDSGFNYSFVLDADPVWKNVFGQNGWRAFLMLKVAPPVYRIDLSSI